jgi:hypothetical protein
MAARCQHHRKVRLLEAASKQPGLGDNMPVLGAEIMVHASGNRRFEIGF